MQGTYETFIEAGRQHYGGDLSGKWILTGGLGGMGDAQPLAAIMAGASCIAVECNPDSIDFRIRTKYVDERAESIDEAMSILNKAHSESRAVSVGLLGNATDFFPEMFKLGITPDMVTDQISTHDPVNGYFPQGWSLAEWREKRESDPKAVEAAACASVKIHVQAMLDFWNAGVPTLDYGNNIRQGAFDQGQKMPLIFQTLFRPIFAPCFAAALVRFVGWRYLETRKIFIKRIKRLKSSFLMMNIYSTG